MATSLPSVPLPTGVWVDLYAATGIATGTQLIVQNIGTNKAKLTESATTPTPDIGFNLVGEGQTVSNAASNVGAWAYASPGTTLQIEVA